MFVSTLGYTLGRAMLLFSGRISHHIFSIRRPLPEEHGRDAGTKVELGVAHDGLESSQLEILRGQLQLQT